MHKKWAKSLISMKIDGFPPPLACEYHESKIGFALKIFVLFCLYENLGLRFSLNFLSKFLKQSSIF